jgi:hypothetical protein
VKERCGEIDPLSGVGGGGFKMRPERDADRER